MIGHQYPMLVMIGDPGLTYWSVGFNSWLVLGPPRVEEWQDLSVGFDALLSNSVTQCFQFGHHRLGV